MALRDRPSARARRRCRGARSSRASSSRILLAGRRHPPTDRCACAGSSPHWSSIAIVQVLAVDTVARACPGRAPLLAADARRYERRAAGRAAARRHEEARTAAGTPGTRVIGRAGGPAGAGAIDRVDGKHLPIVEGECGTSHGEAPCPYGRAASSGEDAESAARFGGSAPSAGRPRPWHRRRARADGQRQGLSTHVLRRGDEWAARDRAAATSARYRRVRAARRNACIRSLLANGRTRASIPRQQLPSRTLTSLRHSRPIYAELCDRRRPAQLAGGRPPIRSRLTGLWSSQLASWSHCLGTAPSVGRGVDLRAQPAARTADGRPANLGCSRGRSP